MLEAGAETDVVNSVGRTAAQMAAFVGEFLGQCYIRLHPKFPPGKKVPLCFSECKYYRVSFLKSKTFTVLCNLMKWHFGEHEQAFSNFHSEIVWRGLFVAVKCLNENSLLL